MGEVANTVFGVVGTLVGGLGAYLSWLSLCKIKKVDTALDDFKKDLINKKKIKIGIESFNNDKKGIHKKAHRLLSKVESGTDIEEIVFSAELNQIVAITKRMLSNHKGLYDLAGISEADQEAFKEFVDMVERYNNTGEGDPRGKMIECIKRLELICTGKDIENELQ